MFLVLILIVIEKHLIKIYLFVKQQLQLKKKVISPFEKLHWQHSMRPLFSVCPNIFHGYRKVFLLYFM